MPTSTTTIRRCQENADASRRDVRAEPSMSAPATTGRHSYSSRTDQAHCGRKPQGCGQPSQITPLRLRTRQGLEAYHQPGHRGYKGHFAYRLPINDPNRAGADAGRGYPDGGLRYDPAHPAIDPQHAGHGQQPVEGGNLQQRQVAHVKQRTNQQRVARWKPKHWAAHVGQAAVGDGAANRNIGGGIALGVVPGANLHRQKQARDRQHPPVVRRCSRRNFGLERGRRT